MFTKFIKNLFKRKRFDNTFSLYMFANKETAKRFVSKRVEPDRMKTAGLLGAQHGRKAGQLFHKLDQNCTILSKRTGIPSDELMSKTLELARTTTLNFDEAFSRIERIVLEYTRENCIRINRRP